MSSRAGGLLYATTEDAKMKVVLYGDMMESCLQNLGDCLINALSDDVRRIDLWLDTTSRLLPEAVGMLESLGRNIVKQNICIDVAIHGPQQAMRMLTDAFAQGAAHAQKCRGLA
ncbi:hypothetical protein [Solidesulfovibrio fructosivorans]|uniref:hypothetical protein n=1 Tax=Solidesulfovibrio fructosivorans TaxID=878 RepID=UPI0006948D99|nr:hypothetical protein [Solidesulfovibrio fructosivorans]